MMMASKRVIAAADTIRKAPTIATASSIKRGGPIAAERRRQRAAHRAAAERADHRADDAGDELRRRALPRRARRSRRPTGAPMTMRAPNWTGTVRLGVDGS